MKTSLRTITTIAQTNIFLIVGCVLTLSSLSCQSFSSSSCGDFICPLGTFCTPDKTNCVLKVQLELCSGQTDYERCSYLGEQDGVCLGQVCLSSGCGNGRIENNEVCDDGNRLHGDGCSADCLSDESCGNGLVDTIVGESCDEDKFSCRENCVTIWCGDGIVDTHTFEVCDQGENNSSLPDASCRLNCQPQRCGDGITDTKAGEECDDGNPIAGDGCSGNCLIEICGNGVLDYRLDDIGYVPTEACDDGAAGVSHDGCASACMGRETPTWELNNAPDYAARSFFEFSVAYDARHGKNIMFGGSVFGQTWEWNGARWRNLDTLASPSGRKKMAMVYDAERQKILLFGGHNNQGTSFSDTWQWDGNNWKLLLPVTSPPARHGHAMSYDTARKKVLLFGGKGDSGRFNDTWQWDGNNWTELTPSNHPAPRENHMMAYDPIRNTTVLFGGKDTGLRSDTWLWNGNNWEQSSSLESFPSARESSQIRFDNTSGNILLFSGNGEGGIGPKKVLSDTWRWDGSTWTMLSAKENWYSTWSNSAGLFMMYDKGQEALVIFAKNRNDDGDSDVRIRRWSGNRWILTDRNYCRVDTPIVYNTVRGQIRSLTCERNRNTWFRINSPSLPPPRTEYGFAFDSDKGKAMLFGGINADGIRLNDTWERVGNDWKQHNPVNSPPPRNAHAMTYHAATKRFVLFGGEGNAGKLEDTWQWDGNNWSQVIPLVSPPARKFHSISYDTKRNRTLLFGGEGVNTTLGDTWEWDGNTWREQFSSVSPSPRQEHAMAYNQAIGKTLLFGGALGSSPNSPELSDSWEWDGGNWTNLGLLTEAPGARKKHVMAYDATQATVIAIGGVVHDDDFDLWHLSDDRSFQYSAGITAACQLGFDADNDGLIGCQDPDCWAYCTPSCSPYSQTQWPTSCDTTLPHCGDGHCNTDLETFRLCPQDCMSPKICGDLFCDPGETKTSCPGDCSP